MTDQNSSNISLKENGKTVGKLVIAARDGNICQMVYDIPDHKKGSILIRNMSEVSMEARTYVDYFFSYDFLVPKTDHLVFNLYMQNLVTPWINKCKLHSQTLQEKYDEQAPSLRALHSASGWFEVTYLTQDAISGVYHIISNWMEEDQHIPVNYSFREGKEITLEELFDPKRNYGNFITNYINGENGKLKIKPNLDRKAGKNERFILRHSGICFVQSEDMVNGRREILMPYDKADEFLRNSSLVKNLRRN